MDVRRLRACAVAVAAAGLTILIAACGIVLNEEAELHLICQTHPCTCLSRTVVPFDKRASTEVLWRQNGDAYCPDGFVLRTVPVKYY